MEHTWLSQRRFPYVVYCLVNKILPYTRVQGTTKNCKKAIPAGIESKVSKKTRSLIRARGLERRSLYKLGEMRRTACFESLLCLQNRRRQFRSL